jgi:hypothetical protein
MTWAGIIFAVAAVQESTSIPRVEYPSELTISSFSKAPHGIEGPIKAAQAVTVLRGDRVVIAATGPKNKEGPFFRFRLAMPRDRFATGEVEAESIWIAYQHGGVAGLRAYELKSKKGRVTLSSDEKRIHGSFDLTLEFTAEGVYRLGPQTLRGEFEIVRDQDRLFKSLQSKAVTEILETDLLDLMEEQGLGRAPFRDVERAPKGGWRIRYTSEPRLQILVDRFGNASKVTDK